MRYNENVVNILMQGETGLSIVQLYFKIRVSGQNDIFIEKKKLMVGLYFKLLFIFKLS